jgi:hypothetical protein
MHFRNSIFSSRSMGCAFQIKVNKHNSGARVISVSSRARIKGPGKISDFFSFPSYTWEHTCGGNFIADPDPSINRSRREMEFRGRRKRSQVQLGSEGKVAVDRRATGKGDSRARRSRATSKVEASFGALKVAAAVPSGGGLRYGMERHRRWGERRLPRKLCPLKAEASFEGLDPGDSNAPTEINRSAKRRPEFARHSK